MSTTVDGTIEQLEAELRECEQAGAKAADLRAQIEAAKAERSAALSAQRREHARERMAQASQHAEAAELALHTELAELDTLIADSPLGRAGAAQRALYAAGRECAAALEVRVPGAYTLAFRENAELEQRVHAEAGELSPAVRRAIGIVQGGAHPAATREESGSYPALQHRALIALLVDLIAPRPILPGQPEPSRRPLLDAIHGRD